LQKCFSWRDRFQWSARRDKQEDADTAPNHLREYFKAHRTGQGIWKWNHYFDIYDRHFRRFRGRDVVIVEIGIYSGGSLQMWKEYFGTGCRVVGVDIEPACKVYESDSVRIFIGDQADREFWRRFKQEVGTVDIVIDDGGHTPRQQIVTLEELLPHLNPGGVYLCEDIHGEFNRFNSYLYGMEQHLNATDLQVNPNLQERYLTSPITVFQNAIESIHHYPFAAVIERRKSPLDEFISPRMGTQWQPFMK
jgi:23S rRNA U2552 (ribose-2'-O)-methylase RlmE/FtsJ